MIAYPRLDIRQVHLNILLVQVLKLESVIEFCGQSFGSDDVGGEAADNGERKYARLLKHNRMDLRQ